MKRWLGVTLALAWALAVGVAGYLASRSGQPTAREQTTLAQARVSVDHALAEVTTAAGPDTVAALSAYTLGPGCRITTARDGTDLTRVIRLYTPAGSERALLDRLAKALPGAFRARVPRPVGSASPALRADAGDFVSLRGEIVGPGEVRLEADAGCRTGSDLGTPALGPTPTPAERAPVDSALRALAVSGSQWRTYQAACPAGGLLRTVEAVGGQAAPLTVLRPAGTVVLSQPQRYAYRAGATGVAVRVHDGATTVTATTPCS